MARVQPPTTGVSAFKEAHDGFNSRDFDALREKVTGEIVYRDHANGRVFRGRNEFIVDWLQAWTTGFSDGRIEDRTYIDSGDTVVALVTARGTNDGQFGPFPATGKSAEFRMCEVIRFDGDYRMVAGEVFYDRMTILTQLGHVETSPGT